MRIILLVFSLVSFTIIQAQTNLPVMGINDPSYAAFNNARLTTDSNHLQKNWSVSTYIGMGTGIGFFNGGNIAFTGTQVGLQVNRRLTNNWYAFVGANVSPVYFNFNRTAVNSDASKNYLFNQGTNRNGWGVYPGIQAGLMYVNDAKTFSISGSIGVSSASYPFYPSANTQRQPFTGSRK